MLPYFMKSINLSWLIRSVVICWHLLISPDYTTNSSLRGQFLQFENLYPLVPYTTNTSMFDVHLSSG